MLLLPKQKNELFEFIKGSNLDPSNFKWKEISTSRSTTTYAYGEKLPVLVYKETEFCFSIDYKRNKYFALFCPGQNTYDEKKYELNWEWLCIHFRNWLRYLKREIEQPNLWEELLKSKIASDTPDTSNEPFTDQEFKKISEGVDEIRVYLESNFEFTIEGKKAVNKKLDYLVSAAKRQGRNDWFYMCLGFIAHLVWDLSMSPEQANTIWGFIKSSLIGIIKLLPHTPYVI